MNITVEQMRGRLLNLDTVHSRLSATEPVAARPFTVGDAIRFEAEPGWNLGVKAKDGIEPVRVWATLGRGPTSRTYQLTRDCLEETCLAFGFRRAYTRDCPAELLVPHMNYWYREGLLGLARKKHDYQFLITDDQLATAFTKQGPAPLSNVALLENSVEAIRKRWGDVEILVDYKFQHDLRNTTVRLVIRDDLHLLMGTGTSNDVWSTGIQFKNSLTAASQTHLEGYLFRWVCTNGQIDTRVNSGVFTRRKDATEGEVYGWARQAVDDILTGLGASLDNLQDLTQIGIEGSLSATLKDLFEHYRIPLTLRPKIISILEDYDGEITMYVIMNAITQVANEPDLDASLTDSLMRAGGDLLYTASERCGACHRIKHAH